MLKTSGRFERFQKSLCTGLGYLMRTLATGTKWTRRTHREILLIGVYPGVRIHPDYQPILCVLWTPVSLWLTSVIQLDVIQLEVAH